MRKGWGHSEIEILRQNYPTKTPKMMQKLLPGRSRLSINHKAARLNLSKTEYFWTQNELCILRDVYPRLSKMQLLGTFTSKDWCSIRHKAFELGLKKESHRVRYSHTYTELPKVVLTDKQIGYFAGIVDGEGMILIKRAKENGAVYYAPYIGITNTDKGLMEKCMNIFKAGHFIIKQAKKNPRHKTCYVYNIASVKGVKQILVQLVDELTVKKPMAQLVLEFIKIKEEKLGHGLDPREQELFQKVHDLNMRGGKATQKHYSNS